ncbi:hypothetical protein LPB140_11715 [Sphingorhabdus lutea]|uniref:FMN-binding negative transcriptional regulator n=1 Tax=Sphingorhabdus lutea TaxID=1913578 RepID=A0A1L3JE55_9SPHN|nr:FMN-binding negative transcriptional regulator [Sphingorhabdus lutea]APG63343.1 hypothetical protein LPB140_11715 [Sphingorhabdus lutea]
MHPDPNFRIKGDEAQARMFMENIIHEIGFGAIFMTTENGPRVAHVPFFYTKDGALQFHISRGNALHNALCDAQKYGEALAVINGPDAYISPNDYVDSALQVGTWNYIALELQGPVRKMADEGLVALLDDLSDVHEEKSGQNPKWTRDKMDARQFEKMCRAISGFEMEIKAWRPTIKLSQNKSAEERENIAQKLEARGQMAISFMMRQNWSGE